MGAMLYVRSSFDILGIFALQMDPIHLAAAVTGLPSMLVPGADIAWKYFL